MDLVTTVLFSTIFLFSASIVGSFYLIWMESRFVERHRVKRRLLYMSAGGMHGQQRLSLYKESALREAGLLDRFFLQVPRISSLDRLLIKSRIPLNVTTFILGSLAFGATGLLLGIRFLPQPGVGILPGLGFLFIPYLMLKNTERSFLKKFEEQLPEAMDLLARAMRTGHALSAAMEMVAKELGAPIGIEFAATVEELKFGLSREEAMNNLCARVPISDLRFFAITAIINTEVGGNITEVFEKIGSLIRERIQFREKLSSLSAEGELSAIILCLLPIGMFFYLYLMNFDYISLLWKEQLGRVMIGCAIVSMIAGCLVLKRMVNIEI